MVALAAPMGDPLVSTNDVWTDPATGDTHLLARLQSGAAAYYHRPPGGLWSQPLFELPATYRARFLYTGDRLVLVYGPNSGGIAYRVDDVFGKLRPVDGLIRHASPFGLTSKGSRDSKEAPRLL